MKKLRIIFSLLFLVMVFISQNAQAQTTSFTYQGQLTDSGNPAGGNYDFQFKLFDLASGGTQQGTTQTKANIAVAGGIFTVQLDFGVCASCFNGSPRFLEIAVKPTAGSTYTTLAPRQPISSTPYAIKSLNAATADGLSVACVSCVTSSQIQSVSGSAVTGTIPVASLPAGSANYIQNTVVQQAASNFNISGSGRADRFDAATQFNIAGHRMLIATGSGPQPFNNLFAGESAGLFNTTGTNNNFFGWNAGKDNTTGTNNSFFGFSAGISNQGGTANSIFGASAGLLNIAGINNSFFGAAAGHDNQSGSFNSFIGYNAGTVNQTGSFNTALGYFANVGAAALFNATAVGANALVTQSNSLVLGSVNGINNATASTNVGIGTTSPSQRLHVVGNGLFSSNGTDSTSLAIENLVGAASRQIILSNYGTVGGGLYWPGLDSALTSSLLAPNLFVLRATGGLAISGSSAAEHMRILPSGNVGIGTASPAATLEVRHPSNSPLGHVAFAVSNRNDQWILIVDDNDQVKITKHLVLEQPDGGGLAGPLCLNTSLQVAYCSSSLRYKKNIEPFQSGLNLINRLKPITFDWKTGGLHDLGLAAEEVEKVDPLLVTYNKDGQVEGVKYDRIGVVLINAVKEQQAEIEAQQQQLKRLHERIKQQEAQARQEQAKFAAQRQQLEALKILVCRRNRRALACR